MPRVCRQETEGESERQPQAGWKPAPGLSDHLPGIHGKLLAERSRGTVGAIFPQGRVLHREGVTGERIEEGAKEISIFPSNPAPEGLWPRLYWKDLPFSFN